MTLAALDAVSLDAEPAFVRRIRLRARRRVHWLRHLWSRPRSADEHWLAISHTEVDRILDGPGILGAQEASFLASDPFCAELGPAIAAADRAAFQAEPWVRLRDELRLGEPELDLLSLAVAVELDPATRRLVGYLQDTAGPAHASAWAAASLFGWPPESAMAGNSRLVTSGLLRLVDPGADPASSATEWSADPAVSRWLAFGTDPATAISPAVRRIDDSPAECLYPAELVEAVSFLRVFAESRAAGGVEVELVAPPGTGKATLAAQMCAELGIGLLSVDMGPDAHRSRILDPLDVAARAATAACLTGSAVYWYGFETLEPGHEAGLHGLAPLALFGSTALRPSGPGRDMVRRSFALPPLTRTGRGELWGRLTGAPMPDVVSGWALTPNELAAGAAVAPAGADAVIEACRRILHLGPGEIFTPLPLPYGWDDIVLIPSLHAHLRELEAQARHRRPVYEDWGFGRLVPLGRGISALFAGPSGTGKTMAAQVLARSLGMQLYRVDLAGVVNKYIGETEKRLKQVFDSCERANVLLLFDEADALFGKRTQVKDAHDRFANIEIDYLLQRMERFDGVAVLTTNRKQDLDSAFLRRLRFVVDFVAPGPEERLRLWRLSLADPGPTPGDPRSGDPRSGDPNSGRAPTRSMLGDDLDWQFLAQRMELSGAGIKAAALAAAFLAVEEGTSIGMAHVLHACGRELTKLGVEMPRDARSH